MQPFTNLGKLEVVIYGIKDLFQSTLLSHVNVCLQIINLEAKQGHRQAKLRSEELPAETK